jgi:deoxycytidylate deaminase
MKRSKDNKFENMLQTLERMAFHSCLSQKHAACLFTGNKIYSFGVNKYYNLKPLHNKKQVPLTIHAELDALSNIHSKYSKGLDILIIRIGKSKKLMNSRPCNRCIDKMVQKGIRKAYYSNNYGNIVYEFVDDMPKLHESSGYRSRRLCCS